MADKEKTTYIVLLRGINVGGHTVKTDALRRLFEALEFENVRSYIQTGNIFFDSSETDKKLLQKKIEEHLAKNLGYSVPVCLRTLQELETLLQHNPFSKIALTPDKRFAVMFVTEPVKIDFSLPYLTPDGGYELLGQTPTELFVVWHLRNGRPGNNYGLIEKIIDRKATTRFWHTTEKIFAAARSTD